MIGQKIYDLAVQLFPIQRSLTGNGVRQTFEILQTIIPELTIHEVPTGTHCFDWTIPKEWNINEAYIVAPNGERFCDISTHNLHVMGYSEPVRRTLSLGELQSHLYSIESMPDTIPYVTSYYDQKWGFCLEHSKRLKLIEGDYEVVIDSMLSDGSLTYGELIIPGETEKEILLSTYVCHPSMANNELSGPTVLIYLAQWIMSQARRYTYRIVFVPETIGSICYLSRHYQQMKQHTIAGFVLTCIGDNRDYSYLATPDEDTYADEVAKHILGHIKPDFKQYSFLERGSDERQYCSPGIDLPVVDIMRTKYGRYPEYHTSNDDLSVISPEGLEGGFEAMRNILEAIENDIVYRTTVLCEPQLGKRGLYPTAYFKGLGEYTHKVRNIIAYANGKRTLIQIAQKMNKPVWELYEIVQRLKEESLLRVDHFD